MSEQLQRLTHYLINRVPLSSDQISAQVMSCVVIQGGGYCGIARKLHTEHNHCQVVIHGFTGNRHALLAQVSSWLQTYECSNTRDRDGLEDPKITQLAPEASGGVCLTLELEFMEPVYVQRDEQGPILWEGARWQLVTQPNDDVAIEGRVQPR